MKERSSEFEYRVNGNGSQGAYLIAEEDPVGELSFGDVLGILAKGKWLIVAAVVLALSGAGIYTHNQTPVYQASATLYLNNPDRAGVGLGSMDFNSGNRKIANEIEIIKSRRIATRVAARLVQDQNVPGTTARISLLGESGSAGDPLKLAQSLRGRIGVAQLSRDVDLIRLTAKSTISEEAAYLANTYSEEYVEYNRSSSRARMTASREFLGEVTERFRTELETAEGDLISFLVQESVVAPDQEASRLIEQVSELQQTQYETQFQLGMAQTELLTLQDEVQRITPALENMASAGDNQVIARLTSEIANLEFETEQKYAVNPELRDDPTGDGELVRTLNRITGLKSQLSARIGRMVDDVVATGGAQIDVPTMENQLGRDKLDVLRDLLQKITEKKVEVSGLQARLDLIDNRLDRYKEQLGRIPNQEIIVNRLERSLQTREQLYMSLIQQLQEARIAEQSELGSVDIVDEAIASTTPVSPRTENNMTMGGLFGLMLGVGLAFLWNALDTKIRDPEDLRKKGHSVLGVIPDMKDPIKSDFGGKATVEMEGRTIGTGLYPLLNPMSVVSDGYRRLRSNIQFSAPDERIKSLLVTSAGPGEGKTVTAINLAIAFAQSGHRTLLIDADLRRPTSHKQLDHPREPGLVDLLFDHGTVESIDFVSPVDDLYYLPAGRTVPNPSEALASRRMRALLEKLSEAFDIVIVDSPPLLAVSDPIHLAPHCDACLILCAAGETHWPAFERAVEMLDNVHASIAGVVLNRFDAGSAYGRYAYGYLYGEYYNETSIASE